MKTYFNPRQQKHAGNAPLHIGFFTDTYIPQVNGISLSLQLLIQELRQCGHQVTVFAPHNPDYQETDPDVHRIPAVAYMQTPPVYISLPGTPRTSLDISRCRFDVLHAHSPLSTGFLAYLAAKIKHAPLVYTYHTAITDYVHYLKLPGSPKRLRQLARWFSTATANRADRVIAPSAKIKELLLAERVRRPVGVIPNGIDLGSFYQPAHAHSFRRQLGLSPDAPLLLSAGRLAPEKNLPLLVEAFAHVAAQHPDAHLVFAGDGSSRASLEAQAAESGYGERIHFLGMVDHTILPDLLHEANLFLLASISETQCVALAEAVAAALPVAAVFDKAFEGMLINGINGLIAPNHAAGFSAVIHSMLSDRERLEWFGANSVELSRNFSIEAQTESLVELYREAIHEKAIAHRSRSLIPNRFFHFTFERSK